MVVKDIVIEDFINYKNPCMFIICPKCSFKCNIEAGKSICQNTSLSKLPNVKLSNNYIIDKYIKNKITKAIVFGGLEPFDTFNEMLELIHEFRKVTTDDIVIYTGYKEEEIASYITILSTYKNIIIKFGRFISNQQQQHYDEILGINLASDNQYAKRIDIYVKN